MPHCQNDGHDKAVFNTYTRGDFRRVIRLASAILPRIRKATSTRQRRHLLHQVRGQAFDALGNHTKAIEELTEAIRLNNCCDSAYSNRAASLCHMGRYGEALSDYDRCISLAPSGHVPFEYLRNRVRCLQLLERCDEALAGYENASLQYPTEYHAWYDRALLLIAKGRLHEAIADLGKALKVRPIGVVFYKRGRVYESLDRHQDAVADYSRVVDLGLAALDRQKDPRFSCDDQPTAIVLSCAYSHRGLLRRLLGDHDGELSDLTAAIRVDPECRIRYYNRGQCHTFQLRYKAALRDFDKAIQLDPTCPMCRHERAYVYLHTGRYEEASVEIERAISLCPRKLLYYNTRALIEECRSPGTTGTSLLWRGGGCRQIRGSSEARMKQLSEEQMDAVRAKVVTEEDQQGARDATYKEVLSGVGNVKKVCAVCSNVARRRKRMQMCSRCRKVRYCSQKCQLRDWKRHKRTCRQDPDS